MKKLFLLFYILLACLVCKGQPFTCQTGGAWHYCNRSMYSLFTPELNDMDSLMHSIHGINVNIQGSSTADSALLSKIKLNTDTIKNLITYKKLSITVDTNMNYVSGKILGGVQIINDAYKRDSGFCTLLTVMMNDQDAQAPGMKVLFFSKVPNGTYNNDSTFTINVNDIPLIRRVITITHAMWGTISTIAFMDGIINEDISGEQKENNSRNDIYVLPVIDGAGTFKYSHVSPLTFTFGIQK